MFTMMDTGSQLVKESLYSSKRKINDLSNSRSTLISQKYNVFRNITVHRVKINQTMKLITNTG